MDKKTRIIVSGMIRSGTSMVMQMLDKGGFPVFYNKNQKANQYNSNGYFETKAARGVKKYPNVIKTSEGQALKIFLGQLKFLPEEFNYKIICISRDIFELWESQQKVRIHNGENIQQGFFAIQKRESLKKINSSIRRWAKNQPHINALFLNYAEVLENPEKASLEIQGFLECELNIDEMIKAVDPALKKSKGDTKFLVTDRAPNRVADIIKKYSKDKVYCEIGIGEGSILNKVDNTTRSFGVEKSKQGFNRCGLLYPHLDVIHNDIYNVLDTIEFDICYLWIVYPACSEIIDAVLKKNPKAIICHGLNYFYHLPSNDEKRIRYEKAYPDVATASHWNDEINSHLKRLESEKISVNIEQAIDENGEIFSVAVINA